MNETTSPTPTRPPWPWWVRWVLWGSSTRRLASMCRAVAIVLALLAGVACLRYPPAGAAMAILLLAALLYDRALVWVDRHNAW